MLKLCALFAVVLVLHGVGAMHHSPVWKAKAGPVVVGVRDIAAKPVVALTDHEIMTVAASLETFIANAGLACPVGVKNTLAFGMMMPRIPVSAMRLRQMFVVPGVKEHMSAEIIKMIGDVIGLFIAPVKNMARFPLMVKVLNKKMAGFKVIVDMMIEAPAKVTAGEMIQRVEALIHSVKAVPCMALIQAADVEAFKAQVPVVIGMKNSPKMKANVAKMVHMKVCQVMKNGAGCGAVAGKVIGAVHVILDAVIGNAVEIAANLPVKIPIGVFIRNFVRLARPQAAAAMPVFIAMPAVPAAAIAFPPATDVCFQQKFMVYHAAVVRVLTNIRIQAIRMTLASIVPAAGAAGAVHAGAAGAVHAGAIGAGAVPARAGAAHGGAIGAGAVHAGAGAVHAGAGAVHAGAIGAGAIHAGAIGAGAVHGGAIGAGAVHAGAVHGGAIGAGAAGAIHAGAGAIPAIPALVKDTMPDVFLAANLEPVLKIVRTAAGKITKDVVDMRRAGGLSMAAIVPPVNGVWPMVTGEAICTVAPAVIKSALMTAIKNIKLTFGGPVGAAGQLGSILTEAQVKQFIAKVAPIEDAFKVAFDAVMVDFTAGVFSTKPLIAIIAMVHKLDVGAIPHITGAVTVSDVTVADVLARHGVHSTAPIFEVPEGTVRMVVECLVDELEVMVPAGCRRAVAFKFAEGWMKQIIVNKVRQTERFALMLLKADPAVKANMAAAIGDLKAVLENEMAVIFAELGKIHGINAVSKEVKDVVMINAAGGMDATVGVVLQRLVKAAAHIITSSAGQCATPDLASWTAFINAVAHRMNNLPVMIGPVVMKHFGGNPKAADVVVTVLTAMYEELAATLAQMATMQDLAIVREIFIEQVVEALHKVPMAQRAITAVVPAMAWPNMKAIEFFNGAIFNKMRTKFSEILSGLLKGHVIRDVAAADIAKILDAVKAETIAVTAINKHDMDIKIKPNHAYGMVENVNHLLALMKDLKISDVPEDVMANVLVILARDVQKAVPVACQLPLRVKFVAALIQHIAAELVKIGADVPLMAMVVPMFDSVAMPLPMIRKIVNAILPVVHKVAGEAMDKVAIYAHTGPLMTFVGDVMKVSGAARPAVIFPAMKARLVATIKADPAICAAIDANEFVMQAKTAVKMAFASPALDQANLRALIVGAGIQGVKVDDVVALIAGKIIPAMVGNVEAGMAHIFQAVGNEEYFTVVLAHIMVNLMEVKTAPLFHVLDAPVYELFMERAHQRLMAEILPLIPAPHTPAKVENVSEICAKAYMRTLHIVFAHYMEKAHNGMVIDIA